MNNSMNKFLLSMLLAIRELDSPLNSEEKKSLYVAAEQLFLRDTAWETDIQSNLMGIINSNPSLKTVFQELKFQLEIIPEIPENLIPTPEELATVIPAEIAPGKYPLIKPDASARKSNEIPNMSIQILLSPEPSETVKKISKFDKLLNLIS